MNISVSRSPPPVQLEGMHRRPRTAFTVAIAVAKARVFYRLFTLSSPRLAPPWRVSCQDRRKPRTRRRHSTRSSSAEQKKIARSSSAEQKTSEGMRNRGGVGASGEVERFARWSNSSMSECAGPLCSSRLSSTCEAVQEHCEAFFWGRAATPTRGVTSPQLRLDDYPPIPLSGVVVGHFVELSEARHPTLPFWFTFKTQSFPTNSARF